MKSNWFSFSLFLLFSWSVMCPPISAQQQYPDDAQRLYGMARNLTAPVELQSLLYTPQYLSESQTQQQLRQACLFLQAAVQLDNSNTTAWNDLQSLFSTEVINDPGRAMDALIQYSQQMPDDVMPAQSWVQYRLRGITDDRVREYFLQMTFPSVRSYPTISSDLLYQLGLLALKKDNIESQTTEDDSEIPGARQYFQNAFNASSYNDKVLAQLLRLPPEPVADLEQMAPEDRVLQQKKTADIQKLYAALRWRLRLRNNPYDLQAVTNLIDTLINFGRHRLALDYFEHSFRLLALQGENPFAGQLPQNLEIQLYRKHLICAYRTGQYHVCIQVAQEALRNNPDDLILNGLLVKAMQGLGMQNEAQQTAHQAAARAIETLRDPAGQSIKELRRDLAWFFCFVAPDPTSALEYARQVEAAKDNNGNAAGLLGCAYVMNGMMAEARELLGQADTTDPIAGLAWAQIHIADNDNSAALAKLLAVNSGQAAIVGEIIEKLVQELQPPPPAPTEGADQDPAPARPAFDMIESTFMGRFDGQDLMIPFAPNDFISCNLRLSKDRYNYGDPIMAQVYLTNLSEIELLLGPEGFLDPHVLVTAQVTPISSRAEETDVKDSAARASTFIPLTHRYLRQKNILPSNRSSVVTEALNVGPLNQLLDKHPQQSYRITFHTILDPVPDKNGQLTGKISQIQPRPVTIIRKAFVPARRRMATQYRFLQAGTPDERIRAAILFGALLREANLKKAGKIKYRIEPVNDIKILELINRNLTDPDFRVRAWSAYALRSLPLAPQSEIAQNLGQLLTDSQWLVRFMAGHTLNIVADLSDYLVWTIGIDQDPLIIRQAQFLQQQPWDIIDIPIELPVEEDSTASDSL